MIPVLLVDDDADMLDLMNMAFTENGNFEVTACLDARDAVDVLKKQPIEVVISDYRMPVMNGGVFVRAARETGYNGLFIIYSGRGKDPLIDQARREVRMCTYRDPGILSKSFRPLKHSSIIARQVQVQKKVSREYQRFLA